MRRELDSWERSELDKQTPEQVALELHRARLEAEKVQSVSNQKHNLMVNLQRQYEKAEQEYQDAEYDTQEANQKVANLEEYLNGRL